MSPEVRKALISGALLSLGLGLLILALRQSGLVGEELDALIRGARPELLLMALGVMSLGMGFVALRWRALLPGGEAVGALRLTGVVCAGLLLNVALPGPLGELGAAVMVQRAWGIEAEQALASSTAGRLVGLALSAILAGLAMGSGGLPDELREAVGWAGALVIVFGVTIGVFVARPALLDRLRRLTVAPLAARFGPLARLDAALARFADGLGRLRDLPASAWARALLFGALGHLCVAGGIWIAARALGLHPRPEGILLTYTSSTVAVLALFAVPGGGQLGWDGIFSSLLHFTAGLSAAEALSLALVVRIQQQLLLFGGAAALAREGWKR